LTKVLSNITFKRPQETIADVPISFKFAALLLTSRFHRPIEGEEGFGEYIKDEKTRQATLSSLAQITSAPTAPMIPYTADPPAGLTPAHISFLSKYLAPSYLTAATLEKLAGQFVAASEIVLHNFLKPELAEVIKAQTQKADKDTFGDSKLIPSQDAGEGDGWTLTGPASKHRYASLTGPSQSTPAFNEIVNELLPSEEFRAWLSVVSSLMPISYRGEARRFRRGLDYTLANGENRAGDVRLDVFLGLSWWADVQPGSDEEDALFEHGGWECYLPAPDENEDPETYQSALAKRAAQLHEAGIEDKEGGDEKADKEKTEDEVEAKEEKAPVETKAPETEETEEKTTKASAAERAKDVSISMGGVELEFDPDQFSDGDFDTDSEAGDDDEGPLLTMPVGWNKMLLVLRDPGVMRFVKYLSAGAPGSRWDVGGEWEVGQMEEDDEEEETKE